jgi:uncharacterized protein YyaL (SSP411 family)
MANLLLHESSPYLLQHAHNPVNWRAWNDETLALAKTQQKLLLISIGYSACHWCHVMEKHCFENEEAARIMNKHFICVKVDREERPDVDAVYMQALQLMNGQGGWPLNCFALPDGRPIYGGTYFPLEKWMVVLENLQNLFETNLPAMEEYAERLTNGIKQSQIYKLPDEHNTNYQLILQESVLNWEKHFDLKDGGTQRVPKFPMPCNYLFLLYYGQLQNNANIQSHVNTTLDKMSYGGLFDQLCGGFARYSTDGIWKVPHFEKMLYDNAQLVSLYSKAFQLSGNANYKMVVEKTLSFVSHELTGPLGEFYSALDADSEGEEGKYYVWNKEELIDLLGLKYEMFSRYFNVNDTGHWEDGKYILMRVQNDFDFCIDQGIQLNELNSLKSEWEQVLLPYRQKRIPPALDDKSLTSWNAMMLKAYLDAYLSLENKNYLAIALKNAQFIVEYQLDSNNNLFHSFKKQKASIVGFLEDYAFLADCFISLYKTLGEEEWLIKAKNITDRAISNFYDAEDALFFFNDKNDPPLIARQKEVQDNVIPSSNAVMAHVLFELGVYFEEENYMTMAKKMAAHFYDEIAQYGSAYACWALLLLKFKQAIIQTAIPADKFRETVCALGRTNKLNIFPYCNNKQSVLPFISDKTEKTHFYLCIDQVCGLPINNQQSLINDIENS